MDLDPQGNASTGLGIPRQNRKVTSYEVISHQAAMKDAILPTLVPGLEILPSTVDLSGAELELVGVPRRSFRLRDAMGTYFEDMQRTNPRAIPEYILIDFFELVDHQCHDRRARCFSAFAVRILRS
jgi:chromosome partitioning protein